MSPQLELKRIADDVFEYTVESSRAAQALAADLRSLNAAEEVVAGLKTVSVRFDPLDLAKIEQALATIDHTIVAPSNKIETVDLAIQYGGEFGPDLRMICEATDLSERAFIELHTQRLHTVEMIGFTPGFAYISGLPESFAIPRLNTPRSRVAAGSVGVSSDFTGIYALAGPGGWPLIGRVQDQLFDPESDTPLRLNPGQRVRFKAV